MPPFSGPNVEGNQMSGFPTVGQYQPQAAAQPTMQQWGAAQTQQPYTQPQGAAGAIIMENYQ